MEMVASSKMRRAIRDVLATRNYSRSAWDLVRRLADKTAAEHHPLLEERSEIKKIGVILITSNRGLCGGFNYQIIHRVNQYFREQKEKQVGIEADLVIMGKKGRDVMFKHGHTIIAEFNKLDIINAIEEIRPLAKLVIDEYSSGKYDKVVVAYTDFISSLVQKPRILQLLPIRASEGEDKNLGQVMADEQDNNVKKENNNFEYLFEPDPRTVLEDLLPRLIEMQIYQALLESNASEHSARMMAMRNASDAAGEMIDELTFSYNQVRQAAITREIAEIVGGMAAVE